MRLRERRALVLVGERGKDRMVVETEAAQQMARRRHLHHLRERKRGQHLRDLLGEAGGTSPKRGLPAAAAEQGASTTD